MFDLYSFVYRRVVCFVLMMYVLINYIEPSHTYPSHSIASLPTTRRSCSLLIHEYSPPTPAWDGVPNSAAHSTRVLCVRCLAFGRPMETRISFRHLSFFETWKSYCYFHSVVSSSVDGAETTISSRVTSFGCTVKVSVDNNC